MNTKYQQIEDIKNQIEILELNNIKSGIKRPVYRIESRVENTDEKSVNWKIEQEKLANLKIREKIDVTKK